MNTPVCSPPMSETGSGCNTPVQMSPPGTFNLTHHRPSFGQNHDRNPVNSVPPAYVEPPAYRQSHTLPGTGAFNQSLRSSFRQSLPRQVASNTIGPSHSPNTHSSNSLPYVVDLQAKTASPSTQRKVNFQEPLSPKKPNKKISFNLTPQEVPPLPKKPPPPRRSESTKLTSPKKLAEPPTDFLKDLQRVMKKKWQVRHCLKFFLFAFLQFHLFSTFQRS